VNNHFPLPWFQSVQFFWNVAFHGGGQIRFFMNNELNITLIGVNDKGNPIEHQYGYRELFNQYLKLSHFLFWLVAGILTP
jgi:hypothetical protein